MARKQAQLDQASHQCGLIGGKEAGGSDKGDDIVKSVEVVQWPDSSLGCPQPGMMYLQVITPGFRVVLTVNGKDYEYHTDYQRASPCSSLLPSNDRRQQ